MTNKNIKQFLPDGSLNPEFLEERKRQTLIQSTGASMRLSGVNITNEEVEQIIKTGRKKKRMR